jgi:hypothetical protein
VPVPAPADVPELVGLTPPVVGPLAAPPPVPLEDAVGEEALDDPPTAVAEVVVVAVVGVVLGPETLAVDPPGTVSDAAGILFAEEELLPPPQPPSAAARATRAPSAANRSPRMCALGGCIRAAQRARGSIRLLQWEQSLRSLGTN